MIEPLDAEVRLHIYRRFLETGRSPSSEETSADVGAPVAAVEAALDRLADAHMLVLHPGTHDIWMANPLSAVPTRFRATTPRGSFYGNCVWDVLGIPAMLATDATIAASCPDCDDPLSLKVSDGALAPTDAMVHFAVPARHWWDDIGYT